MCASVWICADVQTLGGQRTIAGVVFGATSTTARPVNPRNPPASPMLGKGILSHLGSEDWTQDLRLVNQACYWLSHLSSPGIVFSTQCPLTAQVMCSSVRSSSEPPLHLHRGARKPCLAPVFSRGKLFYSCETALSLRLCQPRGPSLTWKHVGKLKLRGNCMFSPIVFLILRRCRLRSQGLPAWQIWRDHQTLGDVFYPRSKVLIVHLVKWVSEELCWATANQQLNCSDGMGHSQDFWVPKWYFSSVSITQKYLHPSQQRPSGLFCE